jgi:hypothetical protein
MAFNPMIQLNAFFTGCCLVVCLANTCVADTYGQYFQSRKVDPTGRYYVVIKMLDGWEDDHGRGGPVAFTIAERKRSSPHVAPASDSEIDKDGSVKRNPNVKVRKDDRVLGKGRLKRAPRYVHVSSSGLGFVTLDVYGYNYSDLKTRNAVIITANDGTIQQAKNWAEIFDKDEVPLFTESAGGTEWLRASWIDEANRRVVVVGRAFATVNGAIADRGQKKYIYRTLSFDTGHVRSTTSAEIITAIRQKNRGALPWAMELASELRLTSAKAHLVKIADDEKLPRQTRTRARDALSQLDRPASTENDDR